MLAKYFLIIVGEEFEFPEPPPDYDPSKVTDSQQYPGLIPPHKLPNPVLDSEVRKQIHRDIHFNARRYV